MASRERDRRRGARSTAEPRSRWHGPVARASGTGQWQCRVCADARPMSSVRSANPEAVPGSGAGNGSPAGGEVCARGPSKKVS